MYFFFFFFLQLIMLRISLCGGLDADFSHINKICTTFLNQKLLIVEAVQASLHLKASLH